MSILSSRESCEVSSNHLYLNHYPTIMDTIIDWFYDWIDWSKYYKRVMLTRLSIWLFAVMLFMSDDVARTIRQWFWYINFGSMYCIISLTLFTDEIWWWINWLKIPSIVTSSNVIVQDCIDGIVTDDLVRLIMKYKWLPTHETKQAFDINNEQLKKLWDNLERVGILKRWPNNARVLCQGDSAVIRSILWEHTDSNNLSPALVKVWDWVYRYISDENPVYN